MASKKFNLDMGSYIKERRKKEDDRAEFTVQVKKKKYEPITEEVPEVEPGRVHVEYGPRQGFFSRLFTFKRREMIEEVSEDLTEEEMQRLRSMEDGIESIEEELEEVEELEEELEEQRASLMEKFLSFLGLGSSKDYDESDIDEYVPEENVQKAVLDHDVKEVLKIAHTWIEQLPPAKKKEFKESSEFNKYVDILTRHGLIKVKEKDPEQEEAEVENKNAEIRKGKRAKK